MVLQIYIEIDEEDVVIDLHIRKDIVIGYYIDPLEDILMLNTSYGMHRVVNGAENRDKLDFILDN